MPKKITNFELRDAEKGRVVRLGDNAMLHKDGAYYASNDDGEWKRLYVVDLDSDDDDPVVDPDTDTTPQPDPDPAPQPDPDPAPQPDPDPAPTPPAPTPTPTPTADVTNAAELAQAVKTPGTYRLAPGDYGVLSIPTDGVALVAADPAQKPKFSGLSISGRDGIALDGLHFKYDYVAGKKESATPCNVLNSRNVVIRDCLFEGDVDSNSTGTGRGLKADGCTNFVLVDCEFHTWWKGFSIGNSSGIRVLRNDVHSIRSDGMNFGRIDGGVVDGNYLHDFGGLFGSGDHRDMIQIQRSSQLGCIDLHIINNLLDQNQGSYTQGIWFGLDKGDGNDPSHAHQGLVISDNTILNSHTNCIAGDHLSNAEIDRNILVPIPRVANKAGAETPRIRITGQATMTGNQAPGISLNGATPAGNTQVMFDEVAQRAAAQADPRFAHFFGG